MTMKRVEVLSSPERRRRWSRAEKERLVAAMLEPDANASDIARHAGVHTSQLFRWRQQFSGPDFRGAAFDRGCAEYNIKIKFRNRGTVHTGGVVERLLGKINRYIGKHDGGAGRSVADRNGYPSENRACLTFDDLERRIALAIIDHNEEMNKRTLKVPIKEWKAHVANQSDFSDEPQAVLLNFLPQTQRVLTPQGIAMFALDYYSP
ncbi:MAG: transposase, partial [Methylobacteriaceae bacterium]|nr:transposase [Methylobacteriaceae bacterium]